MALRHLLARVEETSRSWRVVSSETDMTNKPITQKQARHMKQLLQKVVSGLFLPMINWEVRGAGEWVKEVQELLKELS